MKITMFCARANSMIDCYISDFVTKWKLLLGQLLVSVHPSSYLMAYARNLNLFSMILFPVVSILGFKINQNGYLIAITHNRQKPRYLSYPSNVIQAYMK